MVSFTLLRAVLATALLAVAQAAAIKHVLLISVDGMHAVDYDYYVQRHPNSNLAALSKTGVRYSRAYTTEPSDSFPGLTALLTGANPITTGIYYDVSYDRTYFPPGSNCTGPPGTVVDYSEAVDYDSSRLDGGKASGSAIDPTLLPQKIKGGKCVPAYPNEYMRVNNIFEVVKKAGGTTAWVDKHPTYQIVQGESGTGVDNLYTPEVASVTDQTVFGYSKYDDTHWTAILHWIDGLGYNGRFLPAFNGSTPTLFGGNLQVVVQAQAICGYSGPFGFPNTCLERAFIHTDKRLGQVMDALKRRGIYDSTLIILGAKHGGAPVDQEYELLDLPTVDFSYIPGVKGEPAAATVDDVALLWLNDQRKAAKVATALVANKKLHIERVLAGLKLEEQFGDPKTDPRTPDVVVLPPQGTIYGVSAGTLIDHGGFSEDDTHVVLIASNPSLFPQPLVRSGPVFNTQVATTILKVLGLSPRLLKGVVAEGTSVLPGF